MKVKSQSVKCKSGLLWNNSNVRNSLLPVLWDKDSGIKIWKLSYDSSKINADDYEIIGI